MDRLERVFLYFYIMFLSIGWITNPLMDKSIKLNVGIMGFFGVGTLLLINYIYKNSDHNSHLNRVIEFIISCCLFILVLITLYFLFS